MHPKMSIKEAADFLGIDSRSIRKKIYNENIIFSKGVSANYLGFREARSLFNFERNKKVISFQIVKGGTGKTSLASAFAIKANLFGYKVLCVDLDQQANLTQSFDIDAKRLPVMIDILADGYSYISAINQVAPGLDLIASRIENALLDDVIKMKNFPLDKVYKEQFDYLKQDYDLIVVDCPPNIGQSVAAAALASDLVIAPVVADSFAISGLDMIINTLEELKEAYLKEIPLGIVLNKYDDKCNLSKSALNLLKNHLMYKDHLLNTMIRVSQEFTISAINRESIYADFKPSIAKNDIDSLTKCVLGLDVIASNNKNKKIIQTQTQAVKKATRKLKNRPKSRIKLRRRIKATAMKIKRKNSIKSIA